MVLLTVAIISLIVYSTSLGWEHELSGMCWCPSTGALDRRLDGWQANFR